MHRRKFITAAGLGLAATGALALPSVSTVSTVSTVGNGPQFKWRLAASMTRTLDVTYGGLETLAKWVAQATGGRFQIQVFAAGELVPAFGVLDAVGNGTVQLGFGASFYYIGKDPTFAFDCALPFGLTTRQQTAWMMQGGGMALMRDLYKDYNVYNIPCASTGAQMGGWFRKEIHSLHDLKGLKIRVGGLAGQVLSRLGATPQVIPTSEVYPALERGTLDAAKLAAPHDDERAGLNRIARYYYMPGWAEGTTQLSMYINLDAWRALPPEYQSILETACQRMNIETQARFDAINPGAIQRMVNSGTQLRRFPDDMLHAAYREAHALYDEYAATNPRFRKVYDHWRRFRGRQIAWFGIAERPYDNFLAQRAMKF